MKLVRFRHNNTEYQGTLELDVVRYQVSDEEKEVALADVEILPPCNPSKIIGVAINYKGATGLTDEMKEPLIFLKSPSSITINGKKICSPFRDVNHWGESELGIVIGERISRATPEQAERAIQGYMVANDVSCDNLNDWDHHLPRSKSADTFCVVGDYIDTEFQPKDQRIASYHNGELLREGKLSDRLKVDIELVQWLSSWMTLEEGDIILTGAPTRVRSRLYLQEGDEFRCEIEGLGSISNSFTFV